MKTFEILYVQCVTKFLNLFPTEDYTAILKRCKKDMHALKLKPYTAEEWIKNLLLKLIFGEKGMRADEKL